MERVHLSLALAALLVLAGCTGGGAGPGATTETTAVTAGETTAATTEKPATTTATDRSATTTAGTENATLAESGVFEAYGVAVNYSAGGDLDASAVAREHVAAVRDVERLSASAVTRTETENWTTATSTRFERDANRSLYRTNATGSNVSVYRDGEGGVMKIADDGETSYVRLGRANESDRAVASGPGPSAAFAMVLAKLQLMPYEEVDTVTRNGTTLTKYEATGPGYYANETWTGNASVESAASTVLVGEDGIVRLFHQTVVIERGGKTVSEEVTVRYDGIGSTTVTEPEWVSAARNGSDGGDGDAGGSDDG